MKDPQAKLLKIEIARNYKYTLQEPLHEHRNEMASKFQNRIDYVNISAYGIGKVKVGGQTEEEDEAGEDEDEQAIANQNNQESRIIEKIKQFEKKTNNICYSLASMAERQDERLKMSVGDKELDDYQKKLLMKLFP